MQNLKIRPHFGDSSLDSSLSQMGCLWLMVLGIIALMGQKIPKGHFWDSGGLALLLFAVLPVIFTVAVALGYFAQLEIDEDTLLYHGPQIKTQALKISEITHVNAILVQHPRNGEATFLEIVSRSSERTRIPIWFRSQDLSAVLQIIKANVPSVVFDERADLLKQNKPLP